GEGFAVLAVDEEGLLELALFLPFVEAVHRHQAAFLLEAPLEGGFLGNALGAGVDHAVADGCLLGPERDEAPAQQVEPARAAGLRHAHHRRFLGGSEVVPRRQRRHLRDIEEQGDVVAGRAEGVASAHWRWIVPYRLAYAIMPHEWRRYGSRQDSREQRSDRPWQAVCGSPRHGGRTGAGGLDRETRTVHS